MNLTRLVRAVRTKDVVLLRYLNINICIQGT